MSQKGKVTLIIVVAIALLAIAVSPRDIQVVVGIILAFVMAIFFQILPWLAGMLAENRRSREEASKND